MIISMDLDGAAVATAAAQSTSDGTLKFAFYSSLPQFLSKDGVELRKAIAAGDKAAIAKLGTLEPAYVKGVLDMAKKMLDKAKNKVSTSAAVNDMLDITISVSAGNIALAKRQLSNTMAASLTANKALKAVFDSGVKVSEESLADDAAKVFKALLAELSK